MGRDLTVKFGVTLALGQILGDDYRYHQAHIESTLTGSVQPGEKLAAADERLTKAIVHLVQQKAPAMVREAQTMIDDMTDNQERTWKGKGRR